MGVVSRYQRVGFHCCGLCGIQRHVVGQFVGSVQAPFCPLVPIGHHGGSFSARGGSSSGKGCLHNRHLLLFLSLSRCGHQPCGCGGQRHRYGEQTHVQSLHVVIFGYGWVICLGIQSNSNSHAFRCLLRSALFIRSYMMCSTWKPSFCAAARFSSRSSRKRHSSAFRP